jgi:hypothetical protein
MSIIEGTQPGEGSFPLAVQRVGRAKVVKNAAARNSTPFKRAMELSNGAVTKHIRQLNIDPTSPIHSLISSPQFTMGTVFEPASIEDAIFSLPSPSPSVSSLSSSSGSLHSSNTSLSSQSSMECIETPFRTDFDLNVSMSAYAVLESVQADFARFMGLYFSSTHSWMTIVRRPRFIERVAAAKERAEAEVAILLLCMRLIAEPFDFAKTDGDACRDTLYQAAKHLHGIIQASKGPSLELIQAGILIALFEHNAAMSNVAYNTLVNCHDMSQCLGIDTPYNSSRSRYCHVSASEEERRRTYWGVVVLDR